MILISLRDYKEMYLPVQILIIHGVELNRAESRQSPNLTSMWTFQHVLFASLLSGISYTRTRDNLILAPSLLSFFNNI